MNRADLLSRQTFRLVLFSLIWACFGLGQALLSPWLSFPDWPEVGISLPLFLTGGFLLAHLVQGIRLVSRSGRIVDAVPCVLCQTLLFGVLLLQVGCLLGMSHFRWEQLPRWFDWPAFVVVHVLRAADLLDILDTLHFPLQNIHADSPLTRGLIIAFQCSMGFFFLRLFSEWGSAIWRVCCRPFQMLPPDAKSAFKIPGSFLVFALVAVLVGAVLGFRNDYQARGGSLVSEMLLWLGDQVLRLVDFADAMNVLDFHLQRFPPYPWLLVLAIVIRLVVLIGLYVICRRLGLILSLRLLGGKGLSSGDLERTFRKDRNRHLRVLAGRRLFEINVDDPLRLRPTWLVLFSGLAVLGLLLALVCVGGENQTGWGCAALQRASQAITAPREQACRALRALQRMGAYADSAVPVLGANLVAVDRDRQKEILRTLGSLGHRAIPYLEERLPGGDLELTSIAAESLTQIGPEAVPVLVRALQERNEPTRLVTTLAILKMGKRCLPALLEKLDRSTAPRLVPILERMDPTWYVHDTNKREASEVRTARIALALLIDPDRIRTERIVWQREDPARMIEHGDNPASLAPYLADLGPISADAVPVLLRQLADDRTSYGTTQVIAGLIRLGPSAIPALRRCRAAASPAGRMRIDKVLSRIDATPEK